MLPLVSIIIPVYNAEQFLAEAMLSALNQTYGNTEIIVIDDGSTDKSFEIACKYKEAGVKIIRQRNKGGSAARNRGLEAAKGKYIKFLDADDVLQADAIENQLNHMESLGEDELVFGDFNFINKEGEITQTSQFTKQEALKNDPETFFLSNWIILISCPLHRKGHLIRIGGFDEKLPSGQESDLHFRLALDGVNFIYRPGILFNYRSHQKNSRISVKRMSRNRDMWATVYIMENKIRLLESKNGTLNETQKKFFSIFFFGLARSFFIKGKKAEGRYHLSCSQQYAGNGIPRYKGKILYGFIYLFTGHIIGFVRLEKLLQWFRKKTITNEDDLVFIFKQ